MFEKNEQIQINLISRFFKKKTLPNLLIIGNDEIDKEKKILKFIHDYYKNNDIYIKSEILYLNIFIDRSIKKVREIIKKFINQISYYDDNNNIILKFIIIKNIENITFEIQYALRRIIEDNNKKIRFILIGNNSQTIIQPLISRCLLIYFNNESIEFKKNKIKNINNNFLKLYSTNFFKNNINYYKNYDNIIWEDYLIDKNIINLKKKNLYYY